LVGKI